MRREVPIMITIFIGWVMVLDFFFPPLSGTATHMRDWTLILIAVSQMLGVANVARINLDKVSRRHQDAPYAVMLLVAMLVMITLGVVMPKSATIGTFTWGGIEGGSLFDKVYNQMYVPMQGTMFSLLAFFIASAAYRAFKIRSPEATILAVTAVIIMIGQVPIGSILWDGMPGLSAWIMNVPNLAAKRAILIGAALGAVATGMKVILGLERNYVGGE
ncbi:MAG TPA: hypothetical protein VF720_14865 [Candidatus Eisenbacteria bacterium]